MNGNKRLFDLVCLAVFLLAFGGATVAPASATADRSAAPPNVVMIISDDQAWSDFGFMGHWVIQTPHLDRLAAESATFTRGYVPTSLCRPSLMTMITGLYPHEHGVVGNDPPTGQAREVMLKFVRRHATLPKLLGAKGYVSHQSGKWWEGHFSEGGFTAGMTHGDPKRGGRHGDLGLKIGRQGMAPVLDFIDQSAAEGKPFFVWYAPFLPHTPHNPPKRLLDKYRAPGRPLNVSKYYAMCEWFDETCGQLLDHLEKKKLSDNTLVVFVTDNGWFQGIKPGYGPKSKRSPYDGGIRTPIMVKWPKRVQPARLDTLVSSVDLAPTILAACGVEIPRSMTGINLLDVCDGKAMNREALFGEIFSHDLVNVDDSTEGLLHGWVIEGDWKLITFGGSEAELFDLKADPFETRNLARAKPGVTKRLTGRLESWWAPAARIGAEWRHAAVGAAAAASGDSHAAHGPGLAVDGNSRDDDSAWWSVGKCPQSLRIDLGEVKRIDRVRVFPLWRGQHGQAYQYTVELSTDDATWTQAADMRKNSAGATEAGHIHRFAPAEARYVRVQVTRGERDGTAKLVEVKVFEAK